MATASNRRKGGATRGSSSGGAALYLQHHLQTFVASLGRLWRTPFDSVMTILVIGVALALPALLHMMVTNARSATGHWDSAVDVSVYLAQEVSGDAIAALAERVRARDDVAAVAVIDADRALDAFRRDSGFGDALDALEVNPLPTTLVVQPAETARNGAQIEALATALRGEAGVDLVQLDTAWVQRFHALLDLVRRAAMLVALLLAVAVMVIVGNTIRMEILSRSDEIEIVKLIGASDGFIRRPFLYSGLWYGLGGGFTAALLVALVMRLLASPVASLAGLYGSNFALTGLSLAQSAMLLGIGGALGWLGSWIAASRHMRRIEPR